MNPQIQLTLYRADGIAIASYTLENTDAPLHIAAENGVTYQFSGADSVPQTVRQGEDLLVRFSDGRSLVIEDYFARGAGAL